MEKQKDDNFKASKMNFLGYRKTGQCGKVVNAEKWSTRKGGQRKTGQREKKRKNA
jgi:hypothetical protein